MTMSKLIKWNGVMTIITGSLFLIWSGLLASIAPSLTSGFELVDMVRDDFWTEYNVVGSLASILLPLTLIGLYAGQASKTGLTGLVGFLTAFFGGLLLAWIQLEETFVWPVLSAEAPTLVDLEGPLFEDPAFLATFFASGLLFMVGFLVFAVASFRARIFPRWSSVFLGVGAALFGIGTALFGIGDALFDMGGVLVIARTVGVLLLATALVWLGYSQYRYLIIV